MTDKEMIEEMARDIAFEFCPNRNLHKKWGNEAQCYSDDNFSECTTIKNAVDKLYNLGYRKIPEGSVVLSMEEYAKDFCSQFNKGYERGSKETAREILTKIGEHLKRYSHIHKLAEKARESKEEYADGTPVEMSSVWDVITLNKNGYDDYETMHELENNIRNLALSRLLQEFEKDFRLFARELGVEIKE